LRLKEDIGAVRRFPLAKLCSTLYLGHGARRLIFPSDENHRCSNGAAMKRAELS